MIFTCIGVWIYYLSIIVEYKVMVSVIYFEGIKCEKVYC